MLVVRHRPRFRPDPNRQKWRHRFLRFEKRFRVLLIVVVALYLGVRAGTRATHRWQAYLMWRHAAPFHELSEIPAVCPPAKEKETAPMMLLDVKRGSADSLTCLM